MSRRLDTHPLKKLRNPARHLRALERWSAAPEASLPTRAELEDWPDLFWHHKVPIHGKLVAARHSTPELRRAVAQALLDATANLSARLVLRRPVRVACLISPHDLWSSEVTVFFDDDYFRTFLPPARFGTVQSGPFRITTAPAELDLVAAWKLQVPGTILDFGGYLLTEEDDEEPEARWSSHRWVFAEQDFAAHTGSKPDPASS